LVHPVGFTIEINSKHFHPILSTGNEL
jgi:hypothetical protein